MPDADGPTLVGDPDLGFAGLRQFGPTLIHHSQIKYRKSPLNFMLVSSPFSAMHYVSIGACENTAILLFQTRTCFSFFSILRPLVTNVQWYDAQGGFAVSTTTSFHIVSDRVSIPSISLWTHLEFNNQLHLLIAV